MKDVKGLTDEELVQLVCTQDQELYSELVRRYQNKLLRYTSYLAQSETKAADITQETFIKAFINLNSFNTDKKFSSWIYRIAHNEAINNIRRYARETSLENNEQVKVVLSGDKDVQEDLDQEFLRKMVSSCLDKIPLVYRAPLALFYLEDHSYEEISDILRIPIGTVGTHINRGKKVLAEFCSKERGIETYA